MPDLNAERDESGTYSVRGRKPVREPVDWPAVVWIAIGVVGMVMPFVGVVRWLIGW